MKNSLRKIRYTTYAIEMLVVLIYIKIDAVFREYKVFYNNKYLNTLNFNYYSEYRKYQFFQELLFIAFVLLITTVIIMLSFLRMKDNEKILFSNKMFLYVIILEILIILCQVLLFIFANNDIYDICYYLILATSIAYWMLIHAYFNYATSKRN